VTNDDWRALLEAYLSDESDTETFKEDFLEAWKTAKDERARVPKLIGDLFFTIEGFDPADDDADLRDEAQKALDHLVKLS
jgi:hypothetical protein